RRLHPRRRTHRPRAGGAALRAYARRRPGRHDPRHQHPRARRRRRARPGPAAAEPARADPARGRGALARPGARGGQVPEAARRQAVRRAPQRARVAAQPHHRRGPDGRAGGQGPPRRRGRARPGPRGRRGGAGAPPVPAAGDHAPARGGRRPGGRGGGARRPMRSAVTAAAARAPPARSLLWPRRPRAYLGALAAVVSAVSRVAVVPLFVTPLFDEALADPSALPRLLVAAGAVVLGGALALWAQDALLGRAAALSTADARRALYADLLARPAGTLPGSSGALASRVITDLKEVETYLRYGLGSLVAESVTLALIL